MFPWLGIAQTDEARGGHKQDREDSPIPVGAMCSDGIGSKATSEVDEMVI